MSEKRTERYDFFVVRSLESKQQVSKPEGGPPYDAEAYKMRREEVERRGLEEKVRATTSSLIQKKIRDPRVLYFVIQIEKETAPNKFQDVLERLSVTVHSYIDKEHTTLLVSTYEQVLNKYAKDGLPLVIKDRLLDFRELNLSEQISKELVNENWYKTPKPVILHLMPNIKTELAESYLEELLHYFESTGSEVLLTSHPDDGMLIIQINRKVAEDLLKKANIVFKIHDVPIGILSQASSPRRISRRHRVAGRTSSAEHGLTIPSDQLPPLCVADSGVNEIQYLSGLIIERRKHPRFANVDDGVRGDGHGTPISCLAARGEGVGSPRAKILSYKVYADDNKNVALTGMMDAIREYSSVLKIFTSSIVFEDNSALPAYARLDSLIQRKNICFVSSAGNIDPANLLKNFRSYPLYIQNFPVLFPAQNVHAIGVGAITRKEKNGSIAPKDAIAPFTRCGKTLTRIHDMNKPDIAEHGGNICYDCRDSDGIGVSSFCKDGQSSDSLVGTSFSAPLVAGRLAEIVAKYGDQLRNAEALEAILYMSCTSRNSSPCIGHGIPRPFLTVDGNHAVFVSEGTVPLSDLTVKRIKTVFSSKVPIQVPNGIRRIDMCLVHSDNYDGIIEPSLDTYLRVKAWKTGRETSPVPSLDESMQDSKVNVKFLSWQFEKKSMEGVWTFEIIPEATVDFSPNDRKTVVVRYGCAIMLTSKQSRLSPLSEDIRRAMRAWGSVKDVKSQ